MSEFVCAFDCGHRTFVAREHRAGLAWCDVCRHYVGVVVMETHAGKEKT